MARTKSTAVKKAEKMVSIVHQKPTKQDLDNDIRWTAESILLRIIEAKGGFTQDYVQWALDASKQLHTYKS